MIKYPGGALITKTCTPASACTSTSLNLLGFGFWMSCCKLINLLIVNLYYLNFN